jgi:hypothetical protein
MSGERDPRHRGILNACTLEQSAWRQSYCVDKIMAALAFNLGANIVYRCFPASYPTGRHPPFPTY